MKLATWITNNLHMTDYDIDEVYGNDGLLYGIRFTKYDWSKEELTKDDNEGIIIKPLDYDSKCSRCINGKYIIADGSYGSCHRCDGLGYITEEKQIRNNIFDRKNKALSDTMV